MQAARSLYEPAEYLALERAAEQKSELYEGEIVAMSGGTRPHAIIAMNAGWRLSAQLESRPCEVYGSDMRVLLASGRSFFYPDISVACGDVQLHDEYHDTLLNPVVVMEVLSPSTEHVDRGVKWLHYQRLPSLRHYVLIAQDQMLVEVYTRQEGQWGYASFTDPDDVVELSAIDCRLPLAELYQRVAFPAQPQPPQPGE